jgi:hypothetical protein
MPGEGFRKERKGRTHEGFKGSTDSQVRQGEK